MRRLILTAWILGLSLMPAMAQQPTPEQVEAFRSLPAAEQQRLMRKYGRTPQQAAPISIDGTADLTRPIARESDENETSPTDDVIDPADTLIVEISGSAPEALLGRRIVVVDAEGGIRLPVIDRVALAGLDAHTAAARLNAEPALTGARIRVQVLPLRPSGEAALKPFGYDIFRDSAGSFAPNAAVPVPSHYALGPGDVINVQLFGNQAAVYGLEVTREGQVMFPEIGPITVGGMNFGEAREQIANRVQEQIIGVQASVTMGPLRSIRIFVLGDAQRPGAYTVSALTTASHALFAASGVRESGSLRNIQVKRAGDTIVTLDIYDLLLKGDTGNDLRLQDGDVVFVPPAGPQVAVDGAVRRPAIYELKGDRTVGTLISIAGGLAPTAYTPLTRVERINPTGERSLRTFDLGTDSGRQAHLEPGDYVTVASVLDRIDGMVRLTGHTRRPLAREYHDGMRVSDLVGSLDLLDAHPDLDYALLRRESGPERFVSVRSVRIGRALSNPGGVDDPELTPNDELIVFGLGQSDERRARVDEVLETLRLQSSREEPSRIVAIAGQVRASGTYPLEPGMRQLDLIRAGGGLIESASDLAAEISRVEITAEDEFRITHFETELDSDLHLQSRDTLHIKPKPYWAERRTIVLRGEVRYPGTYTVRRNERLSQVIGRAGGLTPDAFPNGAVFMRESLRQKEQEQIELMAERLQIDVATARIGQQGDAIQQQLAAAQALAAQLRATKAAGRLVIDLPGVLANAGDPERDVDLKDGDILVIPKRPQEVTIVGEVHYPTSHFWDSGRDLDAYLNLSGGTTNRADGKAIYLIRANGSVEPATTGSFGRGSKRVRPGDTIIVPIDTDRVPRLVLWTNISQIMYQIGVAAAAWNSVGVF